MDQHVRIAESCQRHCPNHDDATQRCIFLRDALALSRT